MPNGWGVGLDGCGCFSAEEVGSGFRWGCADWAWAGRDVVLVGKDWLFDGACCFC
jgi:hypothetical protein